jgi:hypothetical protein
VFVEFHETMADAILREKRIKKWRRTWKLGLIERHNRQWRDLYEELARERSPPVHARDRLWVPAFAGTTGGRKFGTLIFALRY